MFRSFFYTVTYSALLFFGVVLDLHLSVHTVKQFRRMTFDWIFAYLEKNMYCSNEEWCKTVSVVFNAKMKSTYFMD